MKRTAITWGLFLLQTLVPVHGNTVSYVRVAILRDVPKMETVWKMLGGREYPGTVRIVSSGTGHYDAINFVEVEDYLMDVVASEMNPNGPVESLKAQAIAARSHAMYLVSASEGQPYDLIANVSQAYNGKKKLKKNVLLAIEATRGLVLWNQQKLIPAYFHSRCGGHTISDCLVWPSAHDVSGVTRSDFASVSCPYCLKSPANHWAFKMKVSLVEARLRKKGYAIGNLLKITPLLRDGGEHVLQLLIEGTDRAVKLSGEDLRSILGYDLLKSTRMTIDRAMLADGSLSEEFSFEGTGHGHGVGLCQYGAEQMALQGNSYKRILDRYYPRCQVATLNRVNAK